MKTKFEFFHNLHDHDMVLAKRHPRLALLIKLASWSILDMAEFLFACIVGILLGAFSVVVFLETGVDPSIASSSVVLILAVICAVMLPCLLLANLRHMRSDRISSSLTSGAGEDRSRTEAE